MKVILEVLDKGNKGILVGDLHAKVIFGCNKIVKKTLSLLNENFGEINHD